MGKNKFYHKFWHFNKTDFRCKIFLYKIWESVTNYSPADSIKMISKISVFFSTIFSTICLKSYAKGQPLQTVVKNTPLFIWWNHCMCCEAANQLEVTVSKPLMCVISCQISRQKTKTLKARPRLRQWLSRPRPIQHNNPQAKTRTRQWKYCLKTKTMSRDSHHRCRVQITM